MLPDESADAARTLGRNLKEEEYSRAVEELESFREWMLDEIIPATSPSLLVLPIGFDSPNYRDTYFGSVVE